MKNFGKLVPIAASVLLLAACGGTNEVHFGLGATAVYSEKVAVDTLSTTVQTDITVAAAMFDAKGKIVDVNIDVMQVKAKAEGGVSSLTSKVKDGTTDVRSKWELGTEYGMGKPTNAGEWDVQADRFENWAVGKTVAELEAAVGEDAYLKDKATINVTIHVSDYVKAIKEAYTNVKTFKGSGKIGVAMNSVHTGTAAKNQTDVTFGGVVYNGDKVVASQYDVYQIPYVAVDAHLTVNITAKQTKDVIAKKEVESKRDLGDRYGMKATAKQGEWYEQSDKFQTWAIGKTVAELEAAVEGGVLKEGATIGNTLKMAGYIAVYKEAHEVSKSTTR